MEPADISVRDAGIRQRADHLAAERRWIEREAEGRTYALAATGKRGLARTLGVTAAGGAGRQTKAAGRRRPA